MRNALIFRRVVERVFRSIFGDGDDIFYVGGPDVLPAPLSPEDEARAVAGMREDPSFCDELISHNLRLVVYISKKFDGTGIGIEDLISIGTIGLIKAIRTFRPEKNIKLATYASRCIENEILMFIRKNASHRGDVSIDEPLRVDWDGTNFFSPTFSVPTTMRSAPVSKKTRRNASSGKRSRRSTNANAR